MADQCVYETALGAFKRGYIVNYFSNAVGSLSIKNIEKAIVKLRKKGINIIEY
jgi:nicotinamidase-related amidase